MIFFLPSISLHFAITITISIPQYVKMTLVDTLRMMEINLIDNNGVLTADYGVTGTETSTNKCFLLAVADGIMSVYPGRHNRSNLLRELISFADGAGVQKNEMVDTSLHSELIQQLERHFGIQIHVRSSYDGSLAYIDDSKPIKDGKVVNVLGLTDTPGDAIYGHFVCVAFHDCLGGFVF